MEYPTIETMSQMDRYFAVKNGYKLSQEDIAKMTVEEQAIEIKRFYEDHARLNGLDNPFEPKIVRPPPETFAEALEEAFWQEGGVDMLRIMAKREPLEFLKICAKLIPMDAKGSDNKAITINVLTLEDRQEKDIGGIEQK